MRRTRVSVEQKKLLGQSYIADEVKGALWSIDGDKAPGGDGYESKFYGFLGCSWGICNNRYAGIFSN